MFFFSSPLEPAVVDRWSKFQKPKIFTRLFLLLRRMAGNAQAAVGSAVNSAVTKAQSAAAQAAAQAAAKEVEKQFSNAFGAALGGRKR